MRAPGVLERVYPLDPDLQGARPHPVEQLLGVAEQRGLVRSMVHHRGIGDEDAFWDLRKVNRRDRPARRPKGDERSVRREARDRVFIGHLPDGIEHGIHASALGKGQDLVPKVAIPADQHMSRPGLLRRRDLVVARYPSNDGSSAHHDDLGQQSPDAARGRVYQTDLTYLDRKAARREVVCRQPLHEQPSRDVVFDVVRNRYKAARWDENRIGIASPMEIPGDPISGTKTLDLGTNGIDDTHALYARRGDRGAFRGVRVRAGADVHEIDSGIADLDTNLLGARFPVDAIVQLHILGVPIS